MNELVVDSERSERQYRRDLWAYRELFFFLAWRDILVRYKQTVIGVSWAVIRPFLTMLVFTVVFGKLAKMPADGTAPYAIMVFAATLPWQFFSSSLTEAAAGMVNNSNLISKVYFPRLIIPAASVITSLLDLLIAGGVMAALMAWYGWWCDWRVVFAPVFIAHALAAALGPSLLLAALNVKYRDFRFVVPFLVQLGLYISPVGFSSGVVPEKWRLLYACNPMVGVIDGFRWALLRGESPLNLSTIGVSLGVSVLLFCIGLRYFRRTEQFFADFI